MPELLGHFTIMYIGLLFIQSFHVAMIVWWRRLSEYCSYFVCVYIPFWQFLFCWRCCTWGRRLLLTSIQPSWLVRLSTRIIRVQSVFTPTELHCHCKEKKRNIQQKKRIRAVWCMIIYFCSLSEQNFALVELCMCNRSEIKLKLKEKYKL